MTKSSLFWFRNDLRLADNPGLAAAAAHGPLMCVYILDESPSRRAPGAALRWWLSRSLKALGEALAAKGGALTLMRGDPASLIPRIAAEAGVDLVTWNRRYEGEAIALDKALKETLTQSGIKVASFNAALLNEPWEVASKAGTPLKVFSPYWRAARAKGEPAAPLPAPKAIAALTLPATLDQDVVTLESLDLEPSKPDWAGGMRAVWTPGEDGAKTLLADFLDGPLAGYGEGRNRPDYISTSRLSPHLRFGEIGPRQIWHATQLAVQADDSGARRSDGDKFLSEIGWREFAYHLLFYNADLATRNFNGKYDAFPWRGDETALRAWQRGATGYPIVDAGMRELWTTGWMHNRVRMIVASFLIKHLLIHWQEGERWFWDTLVDADPANNAASWQWVAGTGADAAPYYRIFNPVTQSQKFDPKADYIRKWVPEIARLDNQDIHAPWLVSAPALRDAGIVLNETYPKPLVELDFGRQRALAALATLKPD